MAISTNGLNFESKKEILNAPFLKLTEINKMYLGMSMVGILYLFSKNLNNYQTRKQLILKLIVDAPVYL
jgi:hypothetical protein